MKINLKKRVIVIILVILLLGCKHHSKNNSTETKIAILKSEHNFGKIRIGEVVEGFFVIKNIGDEYLIYDKVITDCSCTTMSKDKERVAKGIIDTLYFRLDTKGKKKGSLKRYLRIITNTKPDLHKFTINAELEE